MISRPEKSKIEMSNKIDVLVIGGGPAGSVSASMLHQAGYSVRVV